MPTIHRARKTDLSTREVDGALMVLDERTWEYLHLNESGALLWARLEQGAAHDDLVAVLMAEYAITAEVAQADVATFLQDVTTRGLLES